MTREEAIKTWLPIISMGIDNMPELKEALDMAIKALDQEPILDKIRAEIEKAVWEDSIYSRDGADEVRIPRLDPDDVFEIIDKYKSGSEVEE